MQLLTRQRTRTGAWSTPRSSAPPARAAAPRCGPARQRVLHEGGGGGINKVRRSQRRAAVGPGRHQAVGKAGNLHRHLSLVPTTLASHLGPSALDPYTPTLGPTSCCPDPWVTPRRPTLLPRRASWAAVACPAAGPARRSPPPPPAHVADAWRSPTRRTPRRCLLERGGMKESEAGW